MVGRSAALPARNTSAIVRCWQTEGRIFAVPTGRQDRYPAFQFDPITGQPRPVIAVVLPHLQHETPWGRALWWTAPSAWLDGRRPLDVLAHNDAAAIHAAAQDAGPIEA